MTWLDDIATLDSVTKLSDMLAAGEACSAQGAVGSSTLLLTAALRQQIEQPLLLVVAHLDDADEAIEELEALGIDAAQLPAMEDLPGETHASIELLAERLMLVRRFIEGDGYADG